MRTMIVVGCVVLGFQGAGLCEPPPSVPQSVPQEMKEQQERMQRQYEQSQQEELERLKQYDPKGYEQRKQSMERQAKIQAILADFQQGKLTDAQAQSQLYPLVKVEMRGELERLGEQVARLERQLTLLKRAQEDPDLLVKQRIEMMVGKRVVSPEEAGFLW